MGAAGRPILLYDLSRRSLGNDLPNLANILLTICGQDADFQPTAREAAQAFLENEILDPVQGVNRFNQAVVILDKHQYHANWKATREGPQVELNHCPYLDLARDHPHLCQIDQAILTELFQTPLEVKQRRDFDQFPTPPCIFSVA